MATNTTNDEKSNAHVRSDTVKRSGKKKNVLDEDTYLEKIEAIITKDFFPDLPKLYTQAEFIDALERKDTQKLWELQQKYQKKENILATPSLTALETPSVRSAQDTENDEPISNPEPDEVHDTELDGVGLDKFLSKNTSEDNESFSKMMAEAEHIRQMRNAWLYDTDKQAEDNVKAIEASDSSHVKTWNYKAKNAVMYVPEGATDSPSEKIQKANNKKDIVHKNTRFQQNPFSQEQSKKRILQAASVQSMLSQGKVGPDGKEILPGNTPRVGGYGFVGTPSPAPGVDASPLMTWGEVEGTPFRLDGNNTPLIHGTPGPVFKIPDIPKRDKIAHELVEKASKTHRAKKERAMKHITESMTVSPGFGSSRSERLNALSPAAQMLANQKLGVRSSSDRALAASYTPSPSRSSGDKTPVLLSPNTTPKRTPKRTEHTSSLTDDLLSLPKRIKAKDFF